jgi:hypothetical protein
MYFALIKAMLNKKGFKTLKIQMIIKGEADG